MTFAPCLLLYAAGAWGLWRVRSEIAGTTLVAAWWWSHLALGAMALAFAIASPLATPTGGHALFLAAATTFCPTMAILGAKRPQHRAWQWIVLSLWVVVALPSGETWLHRPGAPLVLHAARQWFLVVLIGLGLVNRLGTARWLPGVLYAAAQLSLLAPHLPGQFFLDATGQPAVPPLVGLALLATSMAWPGRRAQRDEQAPGDDPLAAINHAWRDFRDAYGTVWSLRVMDRFNAAARQHGRAWELGWSGLARREWALEHSDVPGELAATSGRDEPDPEREESLDAAWRELRMLLLRFVSDPWLAQRMGQGATAARANDHSPNSSPRSRNISSRTGPQS